MPTELLPFVEIKPSESPIASVIWLHGLGADGHDFANIVPELNLPKTLPIRFIFPHAPMRAVTINNGYVMRAWYDILGADFNAREDEKSIRESAEDIYRLIEKEHQLGIPYNRIILAGFSQGGAMALHCGLRYSHRLAGILVLSAYLPLAPVFLQEASAANKGLPIFMGHGTQDPLLPLTWAEMSADFLKRAGCPIEFHCYPMPHSVCTDEIRDISLWLQTQFSSLKE